jgi:hypothetical protein
MNLSRIAVTVLLSAAFVWAVPETTCKADSAMMLKRKPTHEFHYISPGYSWIGFQDFNKALNAQGFSAFPEKVWSLTFGGYKDYRRLVMEHFLTLGIWGDNFDNGLRSSLMNAGFVANLGFNVLPPELGVSVYPYIGLGVGTMSLRVKSSTKTFTQLLASAEPNLNMWQITPLLNFGVGSNYILSKKDAAKGLAVGMRAGYLLDLYNNKKWRSDGMTVTGIPSIMQSGAYVRLIIGGWHEHKRMKRDEK